MNFSEKLEEYAELVEANDRKIMKVIKDRGVYSFLHMCKENLGMHRYASYIDETDVFNWGVYETNFSLEQGRELFKGKTVIVFSLPGAFTPTCSSVHLPGYNELAPVFKEKDIVAWMPIPDCPDHICRSNDTPLEWHASTR